MSKLPGALQNVPFPVIGSPLFIVSNPQLLIAQCKAGIVGSMPALNARPAEQLDDWLAEITETLAAHNRAHPDQPAAPFAINQIVHRTNERLEHDMALCEKYKVPILITSLGAREDVFQAAHGWGGVVMHDIINNSFAHKAIDKGADGLIAVAAGAGGMRASRARLRWCRKSANGLTARWPCRAALRMAAPCWLRKRWAPILPISVRPLLPPTRHARWRSTSR